MTTIWRPVSLVLLGIAAAAGPARAADPPILVVVEAAPGSDVGAADVRQIIASELGAVVIGARAPNAATASDILLVSLDPHEIRMSLRTGATPVVSRTIAAPSDRSGRLHSIAWLAGNLGRDQVGPIVASAGVPSPAVAETSQPTQPPALPVSPPPQFDDSGPAAVVASRPSPPSDEVRHAPWSITASGGPAATIFLGTSTGQTTAVRSTAYLIDVQHQSAPGSALLGVGVETGPDEPAHYFGAAAFIGSGWHRRGWFLEGSLGAGVEVLAGRRIKTVTVTNNSPQLAPETTTTASLEPTPGLYARVAGLAGVRVSRDLDLVARLGAHLSTSGQLGSFLSSTVGVRLRLP